MVIHYKTDDATLSGIYTQASGRATDTSEKKHPNFRVSKYTTTRVESTGRDWITGTKMYQNNIGPEVYRPIRTCTYLWETDNK